MKTSSLLLALLAASCTSTRPSSPSPSPSPSSSSSSSSSPSPSPAPAADPADSYLSLGERLAREAGARPAGAIPAEKVAATLAAAGVPVGPLHQVLARTVGARYCALGRTPAGLVVSICEFAGDDEAARGLALSQRTFDQLIPGRRLARNHGTVLTLTSGPPDGARDAQVARAAAAFAAI